MEEEMIDIFDEDDNYIDTVPKTVARGECLLRRGVDVLVFNSDGKLLIHRRAPQKRSYANQWDFRITGWVISGETTEEAGLREMKEEIGVKDAELKFLFKYRFKFSTTNNDFSYMYITTYDGKIISKEDEISEYRWVDPVELGKLIEEMDFSDLDKAIYEKIKDKLFEKIGERI